MQRLFFALTLLSALGCGLISGVFFAFSTFVMKGLSRLAPAQAIAAMQSINITAITPTFMIALFGTAGLCVALAFVSLGLWSNPYARFALSASVVYLLGTIVVTAACNVPLNNTLAALASSADASAIVWTRYLKEWTNWNHVRTVSSLLAALLLVLALAKASAAAQMRDL